MSRQYSLLIIYVISSINTMPCVLPLHFINSSDGFELVKALQKGTEPRYDLRIIVMGHLAAGKTTIIQRLLKVAFDMGLTKSTNGIVITKKGGIRLKDGQWVDKPFSSDSEEILKRMKTVTLSTNSPTTVQDSEKMSKNEEMVYNTGAEEDASEIERIFPEKDRICPLLIWDLAGQSVYNSCHQMFMSYRAVYLLVFDISKSLDYEIEDDDVFVLGSQRRMSLQEFTEFLLSSIHMYHGQKQEAFPKVFLIGTHSDLVGKGVAQNRMKELKQAISRTPKLQSHIVGDFIVDNTVSDDPELEKLKQAIFESVQKESFWGEKVPSSWMPLEKEILSQRDVMKKRVLTLQYIRQLNQECYIKLETDEEMHAFLEFQNSLGNMMFFGGNHPGNLVILDPQWLIDALKQIITHEKFKPPEVKRLWKELRDSAKLHRELIEAVWSQNEDKTFINHMDKVLEILKSTDIVCSPKVYTDDGKSKEVDYVIFPPMLKPNKNGMRIINAYKRVCQSRSSTFCFVFKDNFMPPAIFSRLQAACIKEFRIKERENEPLLFFQAAVFKLNNALDLYLEQCHHTIRVTMVSVLEKRINSQHCRSVLSIINEKLTELTKLYHGFDKDTELPYYKAIGCGQEEGSLERLIRLEDLKTPGTFLCEKHEPEKWHILKTSDLLRVWSENSFMNSLKNNHPSLSTIKGAFATGDGRLIKDIGRLARRLSNEQLSLTASTVLTTAEIERSKTDNKDSVIDQKFEILVIWASKYGKNFSIEKLREAFEIAGQHVDFEQALKNKEYTDCFVGVPESFLDKTLNDVSVDLICQRTGKEYKQLFVELELDHEIIERAVIEHSRVIERTRTMLREWMFSRGAAATYRAVGQAIVEVGMDISIIQDCHSVRIK